MWTVNEGISVLREKGAKITAQRIAILRQLEGRTDHPSADTLYKELSVEYPTMSVATVYSTAQLLAEAGTDQDPQHRRQKGLL
jgi:Fur family peroxide stress response transcriptional regulator